MSVANPKRETRPGLLGNGGTNPHSPLFRHHPASLGSPGSVLHPLKGGGLKGILVRDVRANWRIVSPALKGTNAFDVNCSPTINKEKKSDAHEKSRAIPVASSGTIALTFGTLP